MTPLSQRGKSDEISRPRRFAYADPPYPGQARKHYGKHPDYAGEDTLTFPHSNDWHRQEELFDAYRERIRKAREERQS